MRIISGKHKGRRITAPKHLEVRPTTDFAKEALFNILNNRIDFENISVLDLFAGIGGISFEFASRGVKKIVSIERQRENAKFIQNTLPQLGFENIIQVIQTDVFKFLDDKNTSTYDLVFADPPYKFELNDYEKIINSVLENQWLKNDDSIFILEHSAIVNFDENSNFYEHRKYGNVHFSFFRKTELT